MKHLIAEMSWRLAILPAKPYCLPTEAVTAIDTAKFWAAVVAGGCAVIALILIGIGIIMDHRRGGGSDIMHKLGGWILGAIIVTAASGLAAIFVKVPTDCVPLA